MLSYKISYRVYEYYAKPQYGGQMVFYADRTNHVEAKNVAEAVMILYNEFIVYNYRYFHAIENVKILKTRRC